MIKLVGGEGGLWNADGSPEFMDIRGKVRRAPIRHPMEERSIAHPADVPKQKYCGGGDLSVLHPNAPSSRILLYHCLDGGNLEEDQNNHRQLTR